MSFKFFRQRKRFVGKIMNFRTGQVSITFDMEFVLFTLYKYTLIIFNVTTSNFSSKMWQISTYYKNKGSDNHLQLSEFCESDLLESYAKLIEAINTVKHTKTALDKR